MVYFTCQYCNANLKRKDIPVHKFKCKRNLWLTCIDCLKDFKNDEYEGHLQCITENEKYGGKNFVAKETGKKQNSWMGAVKRVIQAGHNDRRLKELFSKLEPYGNVPRHKKKFENFARNSFGSRFSVDVFNRAFELFMKEFSKDSEEQGNKKEDDSSGEKENGVKQKKRKSPDDDDKDAEEDDATNGEVSPSKSKKRKRSLSASGCDVSTQESSGETVEKEEDTTEKQEVKISKKMKKQKKKLEKYQAEIEEIQNQVPETDEEDVEPQKKKKKKQKKDAAPEDVPVEKGTEGTEQPTEDCDKFNWFEVIRKVLAQAPGNELPLKKLGRKVTSEYWRLSELKAGGTHIKDPNKVQIRFNKKVVKTLGVKVLNDRAKLVE